MLLDSSQGISIKMHEELKNIAKNHTWLKFFIQLKHYARGQPIKITYKETTLFRQYNGIKIHFEWLQNIHFNLFFQTHIS
jgi:hypothetical protein